MASIDYINAAFDSVMHDLPGLIRLLPDIPFIDEQAVAMQKLKSQEGKVIILKLVKNAIASGEAADKKKES